MEFSRRDFVATSLAGAAGLYVSGSITAEVVEGSQLAAEDGYKLWLRYAPPPGAAAAPYRSSIRQIVVEGNLQGTLKIVQDELTAALGSMLGAPVPAASSVSAAAVVAGTPTSSPAIRGLNLTPALNAAGPEGYVIRTARVANQPVIAIASTSDVGVLYGTFHFLRLLQTGQSIERLDVSEKPRVQIRMLNHWDNINGSIERGYAGGSLWQWNELPGTVSPRYADYARANASIGINGAAINNVNASGPNARLLTPEYIQKVAAIAAAFRPYGVRMYLSANFAAPEQVGGLKTADPLDPAVIAWWKGKVDEIYAQIPDFGGFLVKANSEGQPGPKTYNRTHAEGANLLADSVAPHKGNIIWRAFIYDEDVDPDRAKRAYLEFMKLEGKFKPNVLVQVKNGAIDFQPREPFHPLFGALVKTPVMAEIQPTQEYLGQAKHLVYLGTMWEEFLQADTFAKGKGSTVARVLEGQVHPQTLTGIASVTNPGLDRNWMGHHFSQSNWYVAGRLSWNPELGAQAIAEEWTRMTWSNDPKIVQTVRDLMMRSHEAFVNYTMPLGFHHLIGGNHYAPMPQNSGGPRPDWTAVYYHQAAQDAVGFDRTMKGNKAVDQYFPPVRDMFDNLATCPDKYLLWFHRLPWDYKMKSGKTLWTEICEHYDLGVKQAQQMQTTWQSLAGQIDPQRHQEVADRLQVQVKDAITWRDQILGYFSGVNKLPIVRPA